MGIHTIPAVPLEDMTADGADLLLGNEHVLDAAKAIVHKPLFEMQSGRTLFSVGQSHDFA